MPSRRDTATNHHHSRPLGLVGQVQETASNLNSGDCFVLVTPTDVFTWVGKGCKPEEVATAEVIAEVMDRSLFGGDGLLSTLSTRSIAEG